MLAGWKVFTVKLFRLVHPENASLSIFDTVSGSTMEGRRAQSLKVPASMTSISSGNSNADNSLHPLNASWPIVLTLVGRLICLSWAQSLKARAPTFFSDLGSRRVVSAEHPLKASSGNSVSEVK